MLKRCDRDVMSAIYCLCDGSDGCLISPVDIMSVLPSNRRYSVDRVDDSLNTLKADGYLDVICSERKGEKMYVISLKESGLNFKQEAKKKRQDVLYKIFLALVGATATFVFGAILKAIFKS